MPFAMVGKPVESMNALAASSALPVHTSLPRTTTGCCASAMSVAMRVIASGSGSFTTTAARGSLGTSAYENRMSIGTSMNTGPRCGATDVANPRETAKPMWAVSWTVSDDFVIGARIGGWSSSCSAPEPHR